MDLFDVDLYPGKPKILFIGWPDSSHTHSWINLLDGTDFNIRLFALESSWPPADFNVKTYVTNLEPNEFDPSIRKIISVGITQEQFLSEIINEWRPNIVHTLGFQDAAYFYIRSREQYNHRFPSLWIAQVRGGPELVLYQHLPEYREKIQKVLKYCDQFIADNQQNYDLAVKLGLNPDKISPIGVVSGTGGIDIDYLSQIWKGLPSQRERIILWPKAFEWISSKAQPVLEAFKLAWDHIKPCRIYLLWCFQPEVKMWFEMLPGEIRNSCHVFGKIDRERTLELMLQARIMLAPSLSDGIPNTMLEAMAAGAFPIVSPLETITFVVESESNVLFARNLYPAEIAEALVRSMNDDVLVDSVAQRNLDLVRTLADRSKIRQRVISLYQNLAKWALTDLNAQLAEKILILDQRESELQQRETELKQRADVKILGMLKKS